jgi:penicillin-binding protein 2
VNPFANRKYIIISIIVLVSFIYIIRLFFLQVVDTSYKLSASNNVLRYVTQYPTRGLIYDRSNELLVYNEAAYDLMINPGQLKTFDTTELISILKIDKEYAVNTIGKAKKYSYYKPSIFLKQISAQDYAVLQEKLYKYPGFFVQTRALRRYPQKIASNILGYVGEVDEKVVRKDKYYRQGDYIGINGIEKSYENYLRGEKGIRIFLVDVHNRLKGAYKKGRYDTIAEPGKNIQISIEATLQEYGEKLMHNKKGSIVAIEPSSGEILAMISSPTYNPDLLVGRVRNENYKVLLQDTLKPLFNRALMAQYPPGSIFKMVNALTALQEGIVSPYIKFHCNYGYHVGNFTVGCHGHPSPLNITQSIQHSCNAYFCVAFRLLLDHEKYGSVTQGFNTWRKHVTSFGFGSKLKTDFPNELKGFIPTHEYYDKYYGENRWNSLNVISLAIGQGEILITPLQMANMAAIIANRGYYHVPHVIKSIEGTPNIEDKFLVKRYTSIDSSYYEPVIRGMELAVYGEEGSTAKIARIKDIVVCGKTGTAENPGEDHSIFIAFAPKDNPKIAIATYVENGGFGATWAAPIASLMIEKYLKIEVERAWLETYVLNGDLINIGTENKHME